MVGHLPYYFAGVVGSWTTVFEAERGNVNLDGSIVKDGVIMTQVNPSEPK